MTNAFTVTQLVLHWQELREQGRTVSAEELCAGCPELLDDVRGQIEALASMEQLLGARGGDTPAAPEYLDSKQSVATVDELLAPLPPERERPDTASALPQVPGYELLGELGRGGMGVVYKARQQGLGRIVALKMILAGGHAGPSDLARFSTEARAVARLQHPNIVQIHEIGEHKGLPYFSLEFCPGGSLDKKLKGTPLPPQEAAALAEILARAIHSAHERGIVHRDLKPANVLLAMSPQKAAGAASPAGSTRLSVGGYTLTFMPKVTDFGLAKRLDEAGQTQSGAVMGTPSYMAPEQARGNTNAIGPGTDVYALGAILYELVTGRPPFRAATSVETIVQVISTEPVPPSRLQPLLPRDLETICLKCLRKAPVERYASAEALAEDLRRFREGEPIRARPVGWSERAWKWIRRRPARAALAGVTFLAVLLGLAFVWVHKRADRAQEQADKQQRVTQLVQDLNAENWDPGHVQKLEGELAELARLDPDLADEQRKQFDKRLPEIIRVSFSPSKRSVLQRADVPPIEEMIGLLARRDAALAETVRQELELRLRKRQLVMLLKTPFKEAETYFPGRKFTGTDLGLALSAADARQDPVILSRVPCTRHVEIEAILQHPSWDFPGPVGLVLHGAAGQGYAFLLQVAKPAGREEEPPAGTAGQLTIADALNRQARSVCRFCGTSCACKKSRCRPASLRSGFTRDGTLRLRATVSGDRLTFQCRSEEPNKDDKELEVKLEFEDALSLSVKQGGVFGLYLPAGVRLREMQAWSEDLPRAPSPLERGDELYVAGRLADARLEYHGQAETAKEPKVRQEVQYKEALCLLAEHDDAPAADLLERVARQTAEERWQVLALCQLWALRLRQDKIKEAEVLFQGLVPRALKGQLGLFMPDHVRDDFRDYYWGRYMSFLAQLNERPDLVGGMEQVVAAAEFLRMPPGEQQLVQFFLFRTYAKIGQVDNALRIARELFKTAPAPTLENESWWFDLREEYSLLLRTKKEGQRALDELDQLLFQPPGVYQPSCLPLLAERACLLTALDRRALAERDLDEFFRRLKQADCLPRLWTRACLMRGLLREQRGDAEGALAAWRLDRKDAGPQWPRFWGGGTSPIRAAQELLLACLCRQLPDAEVETLARKLAEQLGGGAEAQGLMTMGRALIPELAPEAVGPALIEMCNSPEGRRLARQVAFRELPFPELYRAANAYFVVQMVNRSLAPYRLTADEEQMLRRRSGLVTQR